MAPSATSTQSVSSSKPKRPIPPGIQTNGVHSSTSSPSPLMSTSRLPNSGKTPNSAASNGLGNMSSGVRSANRAKRETPGQLLGRGQRNSSAGLRSASGLGEPSAPQGVDPLPYIKSDEYILKRYRNSKPSLIVHLHPTHFRFDQQEGSFSYKSPMRVLIEHIRLRTIPHDLLEFLNDVPFYEGCMIIQLHDHKSSATSQGQTQTKSGAAKPTPFSVHNYNAYLTPSSHVPFPSQGSSLGNGKGSSENDDTNKVKSAEQKDKENMPAPPGPPTSDALRNKAVSLPQKPKVFTVVLRPTPLSNHVDLSIKATESFSTPDGRRDSRQDAGPLSATIPPTPSAILPPTPQTIMAPPAKRLKKSKTDLDSSNIYAAESQIALATTAPLVLDVVSDVNEANALLKKLEHPMHSGKPPLPKSRKRTVAEMAADEAFAAEQERYMLIMDERLSSNAASAQGSGNPADGDGQTGGVSFEPRFERFKTLENIKLNHEQAKRDEKLKKEEADRKQSADRERERLRLESLKKEENQDKVRAALAQQAAASNAARAQAQEALQRRTLLTQQAQQGHQGIPAQMPGQHGHPQATNLLANGMQAQPQRFHNQQVSQAQASSPIVRNGTPQSASSPTVNNTMGNVPMQHSTSSMGGSPPRPGSVVHQNHPQMGAPGSHGMTTQRSQQSHAGTPRMPVSTPNIQQTPLNRQMSQTPRMSQGSPIQGQMAQTPNVPLLANAHLTQQQQQQLQNQQMMRMMQARQQGQAIGNGQQPTPQHLMMMRQQQQQQQQLGMANNPHYQQQMAAAMAARQQQQNINQQNFMGVGQVPNMQQIQMQQMQMRHAQQQAQQQAQAHAQAQAQAQVQRQQHPQQTMNPIIQQQIQQRAQQIYQERLPQIAQSHPSGIPPEVENQFRLACRQEAQRTVLQMMQRRQQMQQAQMMAQQQQGMNAMQNGMQNGMSM